MTEHSGPCRTRLAGKYIAPRCANCKAKRVGSPKRGVRKPYERQIVDDVVVERLLRGELVDANGSEVREAARRRRQR